MAQLESAGNLPQSGREIINGCAGSIRYAKESGGPFQGLFNGIEINCQRCGIASVGLGETLLGMNLPIFAEKVPQETKQFLAWFCGVARGVIRPRRRDILSTKAQLQNNPTTLNDVLLEKLGLPPRPIDVLTRLLQGQETMQIHQEMGIKIGTVYRYMHKIRDALGVETTHQAIIKAIELSSEVSNPKSNKLESQ